MVTSLVGCSGASRSQAGQEGSALRKELEQSKSDVSRLEQRVADLELELRESKERVSALTTSRSLWRSTGERESSSEAGAGYTEDEREVAKGGVAGAASGDEAAPRPTLRIVGAKGRAGEQPYVEVTFPADGGTKAPGDSGAVGKAKEREESMAKGDFDEAQRFWATKNYGRALEAFGDFVVRYPDHAKVDMALFRRGECYLAIGECGRASEQFLEVVRRFPDGKLAAESLFKVGVCQNQQGRSSEASQTFQRLARDYPRSEAARRIPREDHP